MEVPRRLLFSQSGAVICLLVLAPGCSPAEQSRATGTGDLPTDLQATSSPSLGPLDPQPTSAKTPVLATCHNHLATTVGTDGDDHLVATGANDVIATLGGDDVVENVGDHDLVCTGPGADTVTTLGYGPVVELGRGPDTLNGPGVSLVIAGPGNDVVHVRVGWVVGGRGDDRIPRSRDVRVDD